MEKNFYYICIYIKQVIGQRNKMFVLITMNFPSPKRHSALMPSQAGRVGVTGVCVDSGSVLESINNLTGKSLQSWAEAKERQAHTNRYFSSHMPLCLPPDFLSSVSPLILPHSPNRADKRQIIVTRIEGKKYFVSFLGGMSALFIYGLFKWGLAM